MLRCDSKKITPVRSRFPIKILVRIEYAHVCGVYDLTLFNVNPNNNMRIARKNIGKKYDRFMATSESQLIYVAPPPLKN